MTESSPPSKDVDEPAADPSKKRRGDIPPGIAAVMVPIIAAVGGLIGSKISADGSNTQPKPAPTVTVTVTASPSPEPSTTHLEFALPSGSGVPFCQQYRITGTIPDGYVLIIFDTAADPSGQPISPGHYS